MTIAYSSKVMLVFACLAGSACLDTEPPPFTVFSATATIEGKLESDGCSYPVTIDEVEYAPDEPSLESIHGRSFTGGFLTAVVNYRLTGRTGYIECGFGIIIERPEISFEFVD
jgi:hypothetical protein